MNKCLIIDGNNLINRSYYASQKLKWIKKEKEMYIFLKIFLSILKREDFKSLFIVFDERGNTFRKNMNKEYKENRIKTPIGLINHIKDVQSFIKQINLKYWSKNNFEGDDLISSFINKFKKKRKYEFQIFSQDKDLFQLISENVKILRYNLGKIEKFGEDEFLKIYGFQSKNFLYYLALMGDKSDNIKGIYGIGEKRAKYIVSNFENIKNTFLNINNLPEEIKINIKEKKKEIKENIKIISLRKDYNLEKWSNYKFSLKKLIKNENFDKFIKEKKFTNLLNSFKKNN